MNPFAAARICFEQYGYAGTSIAMICDVAGLKNGSVYNAAPRGKVELAEVAYQVIYGELQRHVFEGKQPKQRLSLETYLRKHLIGPYMGWMASNFGRAAFLLGTEALVRTEPWPALVEARFAMSERLNGAFRAHVLADYALTKLPQQLAESLVFGMAQSVVARRLWRQSRVGLLQDYVPFVSASTAAALKSVWKQDELLERRAQRSPSTLLGQEVIPLPGARIGQGKFR